MLEDWAAFCSRCLNLRAQIAALGDCEGLTAQALAAVLREILGAFDQEPAEFSQTGDLSGVDI